MPIGKNKKRLVAYVLNATKDAIIAEANATGKSASKIAGKILDERFKAVDDFGDLSKMSNVCAKTYSDSIKDKVFNDLVCGGFAMTKTTDKGVEYIDPMSPEFNEIETTERQIRSIHKMHTEIALEDFISYSFQLLRQIQVVVYPNEMTISYLGDMYDKAEIVKKVNEVIKTFIRLPPLRFLPPKVKP